MDKFLSKCCALNANCKIKISFSDATNGSGKNNSIVLYMNRQQVQYLFFSIGKNVLLTWLQWEKVKRKAKNSAEIIEAIQKLKKKHNSD